jgi:hypothetical protein
MVIEDKLFPFLLVEVVVVVTLSTNSDAATITLDV